MVLTSRKGSLDLDQSFLPQYHGKLPVELVELRLYFSDIGTDSHNLKAPGETLILCFGMEQTKSSGNIIHEQPLEIDLVYTIT